MDDIVNWAKQFAENTWERLEFVSKYQSAKLHETTITDDLVYNIFKKFVDQSSHVKLKHATNEKYNGNDLLIEFNFTNRSPLIFPIQAKRIYGKFKYPRISHKGQLDGLLSYAKDIGGTPLYLLYNYFPRQFPLSEQIPGTKLIKEHYGCSLVKADYIKTNFEHARRRNNEYVWRIPDFTSLHPDHAAPWHLLFENPHFFITSLGVKENNNEQLLLNKNKSLENLKDSNWELVTSKFLPATTASDSLNLYQKDSNTFAPRFKIVIDLI